MVGRRWEVGIDYCTEHFTIKVLGRGAGRCFRAKRHSSQTWGIFEIRILLTSSALWRFCSMDNNTISFFMQVMMSIDTRQQD